MLPSICRLCKPVLRICAALRQFFLKDAESYTAISSCQHNGCIETLPFADPTTIHTQHKSGSLPEILEDRLS